MKFSYFSFLLKTKIYLVVVFTMLFLVACGSGGGSSTSSSNGSNTTPQPTNTYTLSGSVIVERDSGVDEDREHPGSGNFPELNNTEGNAQSISNPVTLGGYISGTEGCYSNESCFQVPGSNPTFLKDTQDFFRVSLAKDQQISLSVFHADFNGINNGNINVSLFLRPVANSSQIDGNLNFNDEATKTFTVGETEEYYIEINAANNISSPVLYTLSLSNSLQTNLSSSNTISLASKFVPGEVIVKFKTEVSNNVSLSAQSSTVSTKTKHGLKTKRSLGNSAKLYGIDEPTLNSALSFEAAGARAHMSERVKKKWQTMRTIAKLRKEANVAYAEPNYIRSASFVPSDPEYDEQWNMPMLELPAAWEVATGANAVVAVIDTGIDQDHIDLNDNILLQDSYDFIQDSASAGDGGGPDSDPRDLSDTFHGSHVAGIIAAEEGNNEGVVGVAFDASLMILRTLGVNGEGTDADIATAILYAAGLANSSGLLPTQKADIINMSLGSPDVSQTLQDAVNDALSAGLIIIAAAGNDSTSTEFYPAAYPGVIAVSAVTDNKTLSTFSNFGDWIDVAAPGGTGINDPLFDGFQDGVLSTVNASEYALLVGTSMAAPHVAGVAALMKSADPTLDRSRFALALSSGDITDNIGNPQAFGYGLINAAKALESLGESIPPTLNVFPSQFGFIGANTESSLTVSNPGSGTIAVSIQTSDSWLEVFANLVDTDGLGTYIVRVDGSALPPSETTTGTISILYRINGGVLQTLDINVFVSNTQQSDDTVGQLLIYLLQVSDVNNSNGGLIPIYSIVSGVLNSGVYTFDFSNIPPGEYFLEASTDNDGDNIFFDVGEARGAYPLLSQSDLITVSKKDIQGLDFNVQYQSFAQSSNQTIGQENSNSRGRTLSQLPESTSPENKRAP